MAKKIALLPHWECPVELHLFYHAMRDYEELVRKKVNELVRAVNKREGKKK